MEEKMIWLDLFDEFRKWERSWNVYLKNKRRKQPLEVLKFIEKLKMKFLLSEISGNLYPNTVDWSVAFKELNLNNIIVETETVSPIKPPLGILPKKFHDEKRFKDLHDAVLRYFDARIPVPSEWIEEYNELLSKLNKS